SRRDTVDLHPFLTARFAADETDGPPRHPAGGGNQVDHRFVCCALDRWSGHTDEHGIVAHSAKLGPTCPRDDTEVQFNAGRGRTDREGHEGYEGHKGSALSGPAAF